jgi:hypothetical protein
MNNRMEEVRTEEVRSPYNVTEKIKLRSYSKVIVIYSKNDFAL